MFLCSKLHTPARCLWRSSLLQNLGLYGRPLRFKYQQAEMMVVRSNSLDDKACLAMLARIKLDICLFSFSLLDELSVAIQIALKLQMGLKHAHVSGWLFCRYIFSKVTSGEYMSVPQKNILKMVHVWGRALSCHILSHKKTATNTLDVCSPKLLK